MADSKEEQEEQEKHPWLFALGGLVALLIILGVIFAYGFWITDRYGHPPNRGAFGDMFGTVNTLFSGLAFVGIIYTILLQRQELRLQRQELKRARIEYKRTAKALEDSNIEAEKTRSNQVFEQIQHILTGLYSDMRIVLAFEGEPSAWTFEVSNAADMVADGLNRVSYITRKGFIGSDYIMDAYALLIFGCWEKLRESPTMGEIKIDHTGELEQIQLAHPFQHFEMFAEECRQHIRAVMTVTGGPVKQT